MSAGLDELPHLSSESWDPEGMDHVGTIKLEFDRLANGQTNLICQDDLATIWLQVAHTPPPLLASYCDPQTSFGRASQERGIIPSP